MGKFDSTETRVTPVFDELLARHPEQWLSRIIALASPHHAPHVDGELKAWHWGDDERGIPAPRSLLRALVARPNDLMQIPADGCYGTDSPATRAKRVALFKGDGPTREGAVELLGRPTVPSRAWYVFEGETWPNVFIETDRAIFVVEGKRTERDVTKDTTWMPLRHQMLRHLDAAYDIAVGRKVVGLFIVEGEGVGDVAREVPLRWVTACASTVDPQVLAKSLPHRSPDQRKEIGDSYAGVTTWQAVMAELGLPPELLAAT